MDDAYKIVPLDQALLPDRDNPLLPTQNIPNAAISGLTIIQQADSTSPVVVANGVIKDIPAPKTGAFLLAEGTGSSGSPILSFQLPYIETGITDVRAFYDRTVGNIRFINNLFAGGTFAVNVTYQLFAIYGKVGST